jgi:hypothetical protein
MSAGEASTWIGVIVAAFAAIGTVCTAVYKSWNAVKAKVKADAKRELVEEESKATILALQQENAQLKEDYKKIFALVEAWTA